MRKPIKFRREIAVPIGTSLLATAFSWFFSGDVAVPIYVFLMSAVLISAYIGRWRAGVLATISGALLSLFFLVPPYLTLAMPDQNNLLRLVAFVALSLGGTALIERLHYLLERERLLNAIVSTTPALTVLTDGDGRILMFNRHCEELTGYSQTEVLGKTIPELFVPDASAEEVKQRFAKLDAAALLQPHENPWRTRDGRVRLIEWRCVVMPREVDQKPFVLGIGLDVTDIRDAHQRIRELDRLTARCELASLLAHELHNPMQALANVFSLLQTSQATEEQWREYVHMADTQLQRMAQVTQRITAVQGVDSKTGAA